MQIGPYRVHAIETGQFALDGGAMFGIVPKPLWERALPADDRNRVPLALRALLVEEVDGPARILIDTGVGQKWSEKENDVFAVDHARTSLEVGLAAHGLAPSDITDVLLTHLHFDHAGGATKRENGELVPAFPNARYHIQAENLAWAQSPSDRDRGSYRAENFEPLLAHGVLDTLDGPGTWRPGIELLLSHGHTRAMQMPLISDGEQALVYPADLIPTSAHVRVPWVMAYDNEPIVSAREKASLLDRVCAESIGVVFEHDLACPAATVRHGDRGFEIASPISLGRSAQ